MVLSEALAYVSTRIILGFVFFAIVTPIGVVKRMFGWDPLHRREVSGLLIGDLFRATAGSAPLREDVLRWIRSKIIMKLEKSQASCSRN